MTELEKVQIDMKLEVVVLGVADVDRAKAFYENLGWRLDADFSNGDDRAVQFTPPGSECSIHFGSNVTPAAPGSAQGLYLIVSDSPVTRPDVETRAAFRSPRKYTIPAVPAALEGAARNRQWDDPRHRGEPRQGHGRNSHHSRTRPHRQQVGSYRVPRHAGDHPQQGGCAQEAGQVT